MTQREQEIEKMEEAARKISDLLMALESGIGLPVSVRVRRDERERVHGANSIPVCREYVPFYSVCISVKTSVRSHGGWA